MNQYIIDFVQESNSIENIFREPFQEEIDELERFINLDVITIEDLKRFVSVYQPDAKLRNEYGLNVRVGKYYPPFGGPEMIFHLQDILRRDFNAYSMHIDYERLHPFTDCNGRSGRALWLWRYKRVNGKLPEVGFLLSYYYQSFEGNS